MIWVVIVPKVWKSKVGSPREVYACPRKAENSSLQKREGSLLLACSMRVNQICSYDKTLPKSCCLAPPRHDCHKPLGVICYTAAFPCCRESLSWRPPSREYLHDGFARFTARVWQRWVFGKMILRAYITMHMYVVFPHGCTSLCSRTTSNWCHDLSFVCNFGSR